MRVLVQRSGEASVLVDKKIIGKIDKGMVILVAFTKGDKLDIIKKLTQKIVNLRIFPDESNIMNKSLLDVGEEILSVSQFTLYADVSKGNRPSYLQALKREEAEVLYNLFNKELERYCHVECGLYGSDMEVNIKNLGPTTIWLER